MRPGPPRGATASLEVTVTPDMTARIDGREIHAVYGTVPLVAHVEQVCRTLLEPHLEPGEEGVGAKIELLHRAPVPVGATISLVATVASVAQDALTCEVLVRQSGSVVARGSFEQRIVQINDFLAEIDARRPAPQPG
jgi:fluoroacetyl-CoA thioesterase